MSQVKYGNLVHSTDLILDIPHYTGYSFLSHKGELDQDCSIGYHCLTKPICFENPTIMILPRCFFSSAATLRTSGNSVPRLKSPLEKTRKSTC